MIGIAKRSLKLGLLAAGAVALALGICAAGPLPAAHAETAPYQVRLVATPVTDSGPSFVAPSGDYLAWTGSYKAVSKMYVFNLLTGDNSYLNPGPAGSYYNPAMEGDAIVFQGSTTGGYTDIYLHVQGDSGTQVISAVGIDGDRDDSGPRIQGGRVVWQKSTADGTGAGIYLYDITARTKKCIIPGTEYRDADIYGHYVVCVKDVTSDKGPNASEIVLYDIDTADLKVIAGATLDQNNEHPRIDGDAIVWSSGALWSADTASTWTTTYQVQLYSIAADTTKAITSDAAGNLNPAVGGDLVVWQTWTPSIIKAYSIAGATTVDVSPHGDAMRAPEVDGTRIAWWGSKGLYYAVPTAEAKTFPDVPAGHHYLTAIEGVAGKGIITGYGDGNFGPNDWIIHQQFAYMIDVAMGYPVTEDDMYDFADQPRIVDLDGVLYPFHYVSVAALKGVVGTYADGTYRPLYRERGKEAVASVLSAGRALLLDPPDTFTGTIADQDVVVEENLRIAEFNGLLDNIVGPDGTLASWDVEAPATRAQIAQLLWNLYLKVHPAT